LIQGGIDFEIFLLFSWFYRFSCLLLVLQLLLLLDGFLSFSLAFGHLAVLHRVLDSRFKFYDFVVNGLIKGEIEKSSS
jgi:hypothetical protein